jgi:hypothetical protein
MKETKKRILRQVKLGSEITFKKQIIHSSLFQQRTFNLGRGMRLGRPVKRVG